jgi:outer membrane immunogenic protein
MKRLALAVALSACGHALAADLPPPQPYAPPPVFSWTGFYLGMNSGYGYGQSSWNDHTLGSTGDFKTDGFLIGGTVGANYQIGGLVIGVEADGDWSNADGSTPNTCAPFACVTQSTWLATVRGRAGWGWDRVFVYGTGGGAFGNIQAGATGLPSASSTQAGWTAGAGVEFAFTPNWTAKIEYLYVDLGNFACPVTSCGGTATTVSLTENIVRAGLNYKFGSW